MLQQIVNVVYGTGAGIFNRYDGIVGLAGFHLIKNIGKFGAATFNELLKVTGSILARRKMGIRTLGPRKAMRAECGLILLRCCWSKAC